MNQARPRPKTAAECRRRAEEILNEAFPEGIAIVSVSMGDADDS